MSSEHFIDILESKIKIGLEKEEIEKYYYSLLTRFLKKGNFENFKNIIDHSIKLNIFLDVKKIANRHKIISNLITNCILSVFRESNYQTFLGEQIAILKFCNEYNLFEKTSFLKKDLELIKDIRQDKVIIANLKDIFGIVSDSLIYYLYRLLPRTLYRIFKYSKQFNNSLFIDSLDQDFSFLLKFFNNYSSYNLFIKKIGNVSDFLEEFDKIYGEYKNKTLINNAKISFITYNYEVDEDIGMYETNIEKKEKKILVSPENIIKNREKIISPNDYNFYSLAMVLLKGLGPQGHGFLYSTPRGELIEICSDAKESEAIIVKYKQFKKQQFLKKLETQLSNLTIDEEIKNKMVSYLFDILNNNDIVDYSKKKQILDKIKTYLREEKSIHQINELDFQNLIKLISNEITSILRRIKIEDQFKTRMNLVNENKLKSEEVARYTCLEEKSHYDVLRERSFFQNIINQLRKILLEKHIKK